MDDSWSNEQFLNALKEHIARPAILLDLGGAKPLQSDPTSLISRVYFGAEGEDWPLEDDKPMVPILQLRMDEMPFRPNRMEDFEFLTLFLGDEIVDGHESGTNWCLRTYKSMDELVPLEMPEISHLYKEFPIKPRRLAKDFPTHDDLDDVANEFLEGIDEDYYDINWVEECEGDGHKLAGWPTLIQSELWWAPWNQHPASPEYVF